MFAMQLPPARPTRRGFLTAAAATGAALVIGFGRVGPRAALAADAAIDPVDAEA